MMLQAYPHLFEAHPRTSPDACASDGALEKVKIVPMTPVSRHAAVLESASATSGLSLGA